jgi:hypothetical protein
MHLKNNIGVTCLKTTEKLDWPSAASWDDLLLVLYNGANFSAEGNAFIESYIKARGERFLLLPVATN